MKTTLGDICIQDRQMVAPGSKDAARLPYLGLEQIESQTGRILSHQPAQDASTGIGAAFRFDSRHVLYSKLRPYLNKVALAEHEGRCTTELIPLLPADGVDRAFLAFLLRSPSAVAHASTANTGARMPRADLDHLFAWEVTVPDQDTQRRIASRLKKQMTAVAQARHRVQEQLLEVKQLASSVLDDALCVEGTTMSLAEVAWIVAGRHILGEHHNIEQNGVPYITGPSDFGDLTATPSRWTPSPEVLCLPGDLLITVKGAGVGKLNFAPDAPTCIGRQIMAIRSRTNLADAWFLYFSIRQQFKGISEQATGATIPGLSIEQIEGIQLHVPPLETQRRIAARLREQFANLQQLKSALTTQLEALDKLPGAYLREAFGSLE